MNVRRRIFRDSIIQIKMPNFDEDIDISDILPDSEDKVYRQLAGQTVRSNEASSHQIRLTAEPHTRSA